MWILLFGLTLGLVVVGKPWVAVGKLTDDDVPEIPYVCSELFDLIHRYRFVVVVGHPADASTYEVKIDELIGGELSRKARENMRLPNVGRHFIQRGLANESFSGWPCTGCLKDGGFLAGEGGTWQASDPEVSSWMANLRVLDEGGENARLLA